VAIYAGHVIEVNAITTLDNATIDEIENLHKNLIALNDTHMIDIPPGYVL